MNSFAHMSLRTFWYSATMHLPYEAPCTEVRFGKACYVKEWQTSSVHFEVTVMNFSSGFALGVDMVDM